MELALKQEIMKKIVSLDLSFIASNRYLDMLANFSILFGTLYEEIGRFNKGKLCIKLVEGVNLVFFFAKPSQIEGKNLFV